MEIRNKVVARLAILFLLLQLMNAVDRSNISFAAVHMNHDLGFDARAFGVGVGCFFISYMVFQFPALYVMKRFGAAKTIGCIVVSWACVSIAMSCVQGRNSFFALRFLLGLTEAGFAPVMLSYAARWIPQATQGSFLKITTLSWPLSAALGAPLASLLMRCLDGVGGLQGWRWLFVAEGVPTLALGVFAFWWLVDDPAQARGLDQQQRAWFVARLEADRASAAASQNSTGDGRGNPFLQPRLWLLAIAYFAEISGLYGCVFWLPQLVGDLSPAIGADRAVLLTMVPFTIGSVALLVNAASSDHRGERSWHTAGGFIAGGIGLGAAGLLHDPWMSFTALALGVGGLCAAVGLFWSIPTGLFRGTAQAGLCFTLINLVGNLSGIVMQPAIGALRVATGSFSVAFLLLGILLLLAAVMIRLVGKPPFQADS